MSQLSIRRQFKVGETIFQEGDRGDCAYIIEYGAVEISTGAGAQRRVLARRESGDIFGEMAIVDSAPRSATVTAVEHCQLLVMSQDQLQARLQSLDPVLRMVLSVILERFRNMVQPQGAPKSAWRAELQSEPAVSTFSRAFERIELEQTVKQALADEQMTLHYQPLIGARDGDIVGFEALARWESPQFGLVSPGIFLPAIEQGGLMRQFTRWVLRRAALQTAQFLTAPGARSDLFVSVNVTAEDICDPSFPDYLAETLALAELSPAAIELEITEANIVAEPDVALDMLRKIRELGVAVSVDDFGTGYSNLSNLTEYPVTKVKIDQSFVRKMLSSEYDFEVVSAIVRMGHAINLKVTAEGVERLAEAEKLIALDCDLLQGFFYYRPQSFSDCLALLGAPSGTEIGTAQAG